MNINAEIEDSIKNFPVCLDFQATQPNDKMLSHEIPGKLWGCVGADIFSTDRKYYLCIVDYHSKFPLIKWES